MEEIVRNAVLVAILFHANLMATELSAIQKKIRRQSDAVEGIRVVYSEQQYTVVRHDLNQVPDSALYQIDHAGRHQHRRFFIDLVADEHGVYVGPCSQYYKNKLGVFRFKREIRTASWTNVSISESIEDHHGSYFRAIGLWLWDKAPDRRSILKLDASKYQRLPDSPEGYIRFLSEDGRDRFSLDPSVGWMIRHRTTEVSNELVVEFELSDFRQIIDRLWLPYSADVDWFVKEEGGMMVRGRTGRIEVGRIELNEQLGREVFDASFPAGTVLVDVDGSRFGSVAGGEDAIDEDIESFEKSYALPSATDETRLSLILAMLVSVVLAFLIQSR